MTAPAITSVEANLHEQSNEVISRVVAKATQTVVITYSGFCVDQHGGADTRTVHNTAPFKVVEFGSTDDLLNRIYRDLNRHDGMVYDILLSTGIDPTKQRITLSVGDIVTVGCIRYIVCEMGFACIDNMMVKYAN